MDWKVYWSDSAYPHYMPHRLRRINSGRLQDQRPYAISIAAHKLQHSVMGLPDPTKNLSVGGYRGNLGVATNEAILQNYNGNIHLHKVPRKLGRLAIRLLNAHDTAPGAPAS